jgi:hypothetical protein
MEAVLSVPNAPASVRTQIATVVTATPVLSSEGDIARISNLATSLTLYGTGFDDSFPEYNVVVFDYGDRPEIKGIVTVSSRTHIVYNFYALSVANEDSELQCKVTHHVKRDKFVGNSRVPNESNTITCANLRSENPVLAVLGNQLPYINSNAESLTLFGQGFDALKAENNVVTIFPPRTSPSILHTVVSATRTHLVLSLQALSASNWGTVEASVAVTNNVGIELSSARMPLGIVRTVAPQIIQAGPNFEIDSSTPCVDISSSNRAFDATPNHNLVQWFVSSNDSLWTPETTINGVVMSSSRAQLRFCFSALAPSNSGDIYAKVSLECDLSDPSQSECLSIGNGSFGRITNAEPVKIARVVMATPTLSGVPFNQRILSSNSLSVTIRGTGFDAAVLNRNSVSLTAYGLPGSDFESGVSVNGSVDHATRTSITFRFYDFSVYRVGTLNATVAVQNCGNAGNIINQCEAVGEKTLELATVVGQKPQIFNNSTAIMTTSTEISIRGLGFIADSNCASDNIDSYSCLNSVALTKTVGNTDVRCTVRKATMTMLLCSFDSLAPSNGLTSPTAVPLGLVQDDGKDHYAPLKAAVTVVDNSLGSLGIGDFLTSEISTVAELIQVDPAIDTSAPYPILSSDTDLLTIRGSGWDTESDNRLEINRIIFEEESVSAHTVSVAKDYVVVKFDRLSVGNVGPIFAYASVSDSPPTAFFQVANVVPSRPSINANPGLLLHSATDMLTIQGNGFDAFNISRNFVNLTVVGDSGGVESTLTPTLRELKMKTAINNNVARNCTANGASIMHDLAYTDAIRVIRATRTQLIVQFCRSRSPPKLSSASCSLARSDHGKRLEVQVTTSDSNHRLFVSEGFVDVARVAASLPCDQIWRDGHPCQKRGIPYNFVDGLALSDQFCQCECFCNDLSSVVDGNQFCAKVNDPDSSTCEENTDTVGCPLAGVGGTLGVMSNTTLFNERGGCLENAEFPRSSSEPWAYYGLNCGFSLDECEQDCYHSCLSDDVCNRAITSYTISLTGNQYPNNRTMDAVSFYDHLTNTEDVFNEEYSVGRFFSCMDAAKFKCGTDGTGVRKNKVTYSDNLKTKESEKPKSRGCMKSPSISIVLAVLMLLGGFLNS